MAVPNTAPIFINGRTGSAFSTNHFGAGLTTVEQLPNGMLLMLDSAQLHRYKADGTPDPTLDGDGVVTIRHNGTTDTSWLHIEAMTLLPDGKILVNGLGGNYINLDRTVLLARLHPDGSLDTSFGNGTGRTITNLDVGRVEYDPTIAVLPDGRIVVATSGWEIDPVKGSTSDGMRIVLARYLADGTLDETFGTKGIAMGTGNRARVESMTVQADGKIIVAGTNMASGWGESFELHRFNPDGSLDNTFSQDGHTQTYFDSHRPNGTAWAFSMAVQADGKIVAVGRAPSPTTGDTSIAGGMAVVRYNADGNRDSTFGKDGKVVHWVSQDQGRNVLYGDGTWAYSSAYEVHIGADGKIVIGGSTSQYKLDGHNAELALMRLHPDGRLDEQFGNKGVATLSGGPAVSLAVNDMLVRPDGSIVMVGSVSPSAGGMTTNVMAAFNADGSPDTSFGATASTMLNTATYLSGHPEQFLNRQLTVADAQLTGSYAGASITLARAGGPNASDKFAAGGAVSFSGGQVLVDGIDIGTVSSIGGSLRITFGPAATQARVNKALQSITYENSAATAGQAIKIDWTFNDGNTGIQGDGGSLSASFSTLVTVAKTDVPYWIASMLQPDSGTQTAAALKSSLQNYIGAANSLNITYGAAAGATAYSSADKAFLDKMLAELKSVIGVGFGSGADTLDFINVIELAPGQGAATKLNANGAQVAFSFGVAGPDANPLGNSVAILNSLGQVFGLKDGGHLGVGGSRLPLAEEKFGFTVMSDASPASQPDGPPQHLGALDIAALQYLYGPPPASRAGNDTYLLKAGDNNFIWDGAGSDTISAEGISLDLVLHLEPGHWDYIGSRAGLITAAGQVTVNYGSRIEHAIGGSGNDTLTGSSAANTLSGGAGKDRLEGLGGDDLLDGGAGIDTGLFGGMRAAYTVGRTSAGISVTAKTDTDGIDNLVNVERLEFADKHVAIDAAAAQIYRLYGAVFGRTPDLGGMGFWLDAVDKGMTTKAVASLFTTTPEFSAAYGAKPDFTTLVQKMYQNVLGRAADEGGLTFWKGVLDSGAITTVDLLMNFSESAENVAKLVATTDQGIEYLPYTG